MIDIQWGNFVFQVEGTAAILVAATPIIFIMQVLPTIRIFRKIIILLRRRKNKTPDIYKRIKQAEG